MRKRFTMARSAAAMRRWGSSGIVMPAAFALLAALTADAAAKQQRPAPTTAATVAMAGNPQGRIATVDCTVMNPLPCHAPG